MPISVGLKLAQRTCEIKMGEHIRITTPFLLFEGIYHFKKYRRAHAKLLQSCPTLCNPMDCSPPRSSVHGILQARILEWAAMTFSIKKYIFPRIRAMHHILPARTLKHNFQSPTLYHLLKGQVCSMNDLVKQCLDPSSVFSVISGSKSIKFLHYQINR